MELIFNQYYVYSKNKYMNMKQIFLTISVLFVLNLCSYSQNTNRHAPQGFDVLRTDVPKGKIDTIIYHSKTVGTHRKALIYTSPGYSKIRNTPFSTFYMVLEATKKNG